MKNLTKVYPGGREVLKNITLAFLPGAKIGVLGYNGAGKSTLLRIMAGLDAEFNGEAWAADGSTVGFLPQEPQLDPAKTVEENVLEALAARSEEHTSELQSLMRISYAVFCLKKKHTPQTTPSRH